MRTLFVIIAALLYVHSAEAQERCSTAGYLQKTRALHPEAALKQKQIEQSVRTIQQNYSPLNNNLRNMRSMPEILIPVVVHVVYGSASENISDDQIHSQIESLNNDFNKTNEDFKKVPAVFAKLALEGRIRFVLAKVDPDGRATTGIVRKKSGRQFWSDDDKIKYDGHGGSTAWDASSYLNIWVGSLVNGLLGYASFPGGPAEKDGVVIRYDVFGTRGKLTAPFNKGRTATHEIGHWLNLKHLWGDVTCGDDDVYDTPKQRSHNTGCPGFPRINEGCSNGTSGDMFMNYMDFTNDACMGMFTAGQVDLMRYMFEPDWPRHSITKSKALGEPWNTTPLPSGFAAENNKIRLYPNPVSSGSIMLESTSDLNLTGMNYMISNINGQVVETGVIRQQKQMLDIRKYRAGIYFVRLGNGSEKLTARFIKQ